MKKIAVLFVFLLITIFASYAQAFSPPAPEYVVDLAGKLSSQEKQLLSRQIEDNFKKTHNAVAILLLPSLEGESIEDVAYTTFNSWKLGQVDKANGILIVISFKERKSRIETGKGVGGELTDIESAQILQKSLNPFLKESKIYDGLSNTINAVYAKLDSRKENVINIPISSPQKNQHHDFKTSEDGAIGAILAVIIASISGFISWIASIKKKKNFQTELNILDLELQANRDFENRRRQREDLEKKRLENLQKQKQELKVSTNSTSVRKIVPISPSAPISATKTPLSPMAPTIARSLLSTQNRNTQKTEQERRVLEERKNCVRREREDRERKERGAREERERKERRRREDEEDEDRRRNNFNSWGSSLLNNDSSSGGSSRDGGGFFGGGDSGGGGASTDW